MKKIIKTGRFIMYCRCNRFTSFIENTSIAWHYFERLKYIVHLAFLIFFKPHHKLEYLER